MFACRMILVNLRYTTLDKINVEITLSLRLIHLVRYDMLDENAR